MGVLHATARADQRGSTLIFFVQKSSAGRNDLLLISKKFAKGCIALSIAEGYNEVKVKFWSNFTLTDF